VSIDRKKLTQKSKFVNENGKNRGICAKNGQHRKIKTEEICKI